MASWMSQATTQWRRVGDPFEAGAWLLGGDFDLSWGWRVERDGVPHRQVRVEVARGCLHSDELPDEAREAIRTQGASAVDVYLNDDAPPSRVLVSALGVARAED